MSLSSINKAMGNIVHLKTTDPRHYSEKNKIRVDDDVSTSFAKILKSAISKVNNLQIDANELAKKMIYDPGSVDIHNVMIAVQKAETSLTFTKSIRDEVIRSYRELINLR